MSVTGLMSHRCTIKRNTAENVDGIMKSSWASIATGVKCLIQEKAGRISAGPDGSNLEYDATCFLPSGTDIRPRALRDEQDQLIQTTPATNVVFLVIHAVDRSGKMSHLTAYLRRLQSPSSG